MNGEPTDYFKEWLNEQTQVRRLLLIDDSIDDCILIQRYTYPYHCEWIMANNYKNAEQAMDRMKDYGGFALIFLDLNLGGSSGGSVGGLDAFKDIKTNHPEIPVVVLSGHLSTESIAGITKHGFAMFAQKPDSFSDKYFKELFRIMNIPLRPRFIKGVSDQLDSP